MKIVVLDAYTTNPGDLDWGELEKLGECDIHDRTPAEEVVQRASGAQLVLTNKTVLSAGVIRELPELRYIGVLATGYNVVDIGAAEEQGIVVTNVPAYGTRSVAQMVFAHILNLAQHVGHHADTVREGQWTASPDFCYWDYPLVELEGKTVGIVGFGRIGLMVSEFALAFGMKVLACDPVEPEMVPGGVEFVEMDRLFRDSDVVSLNCPLTDSNRQMVNRDRIELMKSTAFLVNTSRGPLIDERALADALNAGRIAGAGLDVLEAEPPQATCPLLSAKNCFITPHIAWATKAARRRLLGEVVDNIRAFLDGKPRNVVGK